jgi:Ca2+-binding RTX toxin-like protein
LSNEVVSANYSGTSFTVTRQADDDGTIRVDGSAVTGYALALNGGDGADTLIGGTGNDTIEGQSGVDVITITSGGTDRVVITDATASNQSVITGFTLVGTATTAASGNDDLAFDEDTYFADGTFAEATTAGADVAAGNFTALTGTAAYTIVANKINVIVGKSYSSYDDMVADADSTMAADGADALIAFFNYATQKLEIYSDLDADDNNSEVLVASLVGVTLDDVAGLTRLNFIVIE